VCLRLAQVLDPLVKLAPLYHVPHPPHKGGKHEGADEHKGQPTYQLKKRVI
jgi:hypothetical protein